MSDFHLHTWHELMLFCTNHVQKGNTIHPTYPALLQSRQRAGKDRVDYRKFLLMFHNEFYQKVFALARAVIFSYDLGSIRGNSFASSNENLFAT